MSLPIGPYGDIAMGINSRAVSTQQTGVNPRVGNAQWIDANLRATSI